MNNDTLVTYEGNFPFIESHKKDFWIVISGGKISWPGCSVTIPDNYVSDGASIPRLGWIVVHPLHHTIRRAALLHDRLYEIHKLDSGQKIERDFADSMLFNAMIPLGGSSLLRWTAWSAVRAGGLKAWIDGPSRREERMRRLKDTME